MCSLLWLLPHPFAQCNALMLSKLLQVSTLSSLELLISELYFICYHSQGSGARLQFEATTNKISIYRFSGRHKISLSGKEPSSKPAGHVTSALISFKPWPSVLSEWLFHLQPREIHFPSYCHLPVAAGRALTLQSAFLIVYLQSQLGTKSPLLLFSIN